METILLENRKIPCRKVRRKVRSARLEIENGILTVILPMRFTGERELIERHKKWITKQAARYGEIRELAETLELRKDMDEEKFRKISEQKINLFCRELGVGVDKITFRKLKSRWGSCSTDGKITVNTLLRFLPDRLIDYILFHEVAHRVVKGHNRKFYGIIEGRLGNRKAMEKELAAYWHIFQKDKFPSTLRRERQGKEDKGNSS
jgi:predicted metal-dependent hydrolase